MNVKFYKNSNGKEPVKDFIKNLQSNKEKLYGRILNISEFLSSKDIMPKGWYKKVINDINEIRFKDIRVFVFIKNDNMYLLHAIIKKTDKIPKKDINLSEKRAKEIKNYLI